ncbi:hypothetical protein HPB50_028188 [Hyalomma asiaticum]|nr:hypothetical protein HPB50_028188 [Hyalomma asiaticum]
MHARSLTGQPSRRHADSVAKKQATPEKADTIMKGGVEVPKHCGAIKKARSWPALQDIFAEALVLVVLCKFYCHHLRKVKEGQPLYTPYDHGAHREHHRVFAPQPHHERSVGASTRHAVPITSAETSVGAASPKRAAGNSVTPEGV